MNDRELLRRTPFAIALINTRLEKYKQDKRRKYFIITNEEYANGKDKLYYKSEKARVLLAGAIKKYGGGIQEEDGLYFIDYIVPANVKNHLIPKSLYILSRGGYDTGILYMLEDYFSDLEDDYNYGDIEVEEYKEELEDILLYSPFTGKYELCRVTHDMTYGDSYIDISLFRWFVYKYGNPGIKLYAYNTSGKTNGLGERSLLRAYGYTVAQSVHLPAKKRQELLAEIVDLNLLSISQIVTLLELQINTKKKRYPIACKKYAEDRDFIMSYKANPERFIRRREPI